MRRGWVRGHDGIRLAVVDYGGTGPGLLLLHGLMGRATTWEATAGWLTPHFRVIALDQRGHGWSDKPDDAYTRHDYVEDAAAAIRQLDLAPCIVIGHSMGALNAWVLAARHPELVKGLVLVDMSAETQGRGAAARFRQWFETWPVPFPSLAAVRAFFGARRPAWADYFMEVMREDPDGYRPLFRFDDMVRSCVDWDARSYWPELEAVRCPTLIVRGAESDEPAGVMREMARRVPGAQYVEVPAAGHVVHYDNPDGWRRAVEPFLLQLPGR